MPPSAIDPWDHLRERIRTPGRADNFRRLLPLVDAIIERPVLPLYRLYPVTSHFTLGFSRATRYPFSRDYPSVVAIGEGRYSVQGPDYIQGEGDL